jgi:Streptomyces sporulation and cell division protein, SsgA
MDKLVTETVGWLRADIEAEAVEVTLTYDPADPLAVSLRVAGIGRDQTWVFARDLLADGLRSLVPVGMGAVRVQATPVLTEVFRHTDDGLWETLRLPWWNTREFIRLSQGRVPRGNESCDVDSWVEALISPEH